MMRKIFILVLATSTLYSCGGKKKDASKSTGAAQQQAAIVDVIITSTKALKNTVETNGSVVAAENVEIKPEISGRLTYLNVPDGAAVAAGTLLAKINDADLQAQLTKSKVQLALAEKTEERLRKLLAINGINQADYDAALNNVNNIRADIQLLKAQIDKTIVKAPFAGVLGLRQVSPGAYVTPQSTLAILQQVSKVKIDFNVPELYANLIKKGGTVKVMTNEGATRNAQIIATQSEIDATTRNLKVRAVIDGTALAAGSFVKVLLDASGKTSNNIVIPTNAIIPDADSKKVIIVKGGKGVFTNVQTGLRTAGGVEITDGLKQGDSVVVTGVLFVRPNAPVKVKAVKKLEETLKEQP